MERKRAYFDATSFAVEGNYLESAVVEDANPLSIAITYRYSRDHRRDLKQFVMNLVCWSDGDIPALIELADGNQSDIAVVIVVRTGCRGGTPGWGLRPHSLSNSNVLTHLRRAIKLGLQV